MEKNWKNLVLEIWTRNFEKLGNVVGGQWRSPFYRGLGRPMGCIFEPYWFVVRDRSAVKNRFWKFFLWFFESKMTIFFDFPKMCSNYNIEVLYCFRTLSRAQTANFRPYMTFPVTSGQYWENRKNRFFGQFLIILQISPTYMVAGVGRKRPEALVVTKNTFSYVFRCFFIPISISYLI